MLTSAHYQKERKKREYFIAFIVGDGNVIKEMVVDRGHVNGLEIHSLTDTGVIIIRNKRTGKLITKLIARPNQVKRFFKKEQPPQWLMTLAKFHEDLHYNI